MNLLSLFFSVWAIEPEQAAAYVPQLKRLLDGTAEALTPDQLIAYREAHNPVYQTEQGTLLSAAEFGALKHDDGDEDGNTVGPDGHQEKFVMVMPLRGAIHRYDISCGPYGTESRAKWLQSAENNPRIIGVVIDADSPGGEGGGMRILVSQLQKMKKPVVTLVNHGMAASAMYGIAAATREIYLTHSSDIIGSIGTYMELPDLVAYYRDYFKLPIHRVFATASTEKNRPWLEALKANPNDPTDKHYDLLREQVIDPFNTEFIKHIKTSRSKVKDQDGVFNGKVFFGDEAISLGLADGYGTMDSAVERVRQLARSQGRKDDSRNAGAPSPSNNTNNNPSKTMSLKSKLVAIAATLGLTTEAADQETINAANAELAERGVTGVALVSTAEQQRLQKSAEAITEAQNKLQQAETRATEAERSAGEAKQATTTVQGTLDGLNTAVDNALTKLEQKAAEGKTGLETLVDFAETTAAAKKELETKLGQAEARIKALEAEGGDDGKGNPQNQVGDLGNPEVSKEEQEFAAQAKADLAKLG